VTALAGLRPRRIACSICSKVRGGTHCVPALQARRYAT
jgi:hypothetical protein